jgi:hypothetical protein
VASSRRVRGGSGEKFSCCGQAENTGTAGIAAKHKFPGARFRTSISEDGNDRNGRDLKNTQLQPYSSYNEHTPPFHRFHCISSACLVPTGFRSSLGLRAGESISHPDTWPPAPR